MIPALDVDIAIYPDRVQVVRRGSDRFIDQPAKFPFSTPTSVVAHPRHLEDTMVRAIRQLLAEGGFSLEFPIAHVVRCEGCLREGDLAVVEHALREAGMADVVFELDRDIGQSIADSENITR